MLHGFTDNDSQWFGWEEHWINLHEVIDQSPAEGKTKEMIVVMPNAYNRFKGSMYSSSITIGDWETFVARELVAHIEEHFQKHKFVDWQDIPWADMVFCGWACSFQKSGRFCMY